MLIHLERTTVKIKFNYLKPEYPRRGGGTLLSKTTIVKPLGLGETALGVTYAKKCKQENLMVREVSQIWSTPELPPYPVGTATM